MRADPTEASEDLMSTWISLLAVEPFTRMATCWPNTVRPYAEAFALSAAIYGREGKKHVNNERIHILCAVYTCTGSKCNADVMAITVALKLVVDLIRVELRASAGAPSPKYKVN